PRRRRAGVLHDFCSRPHRRAAGPGGRALRRSPATVGSCGIVASAFGCPCTGPAASHKRRRYCAPVGASDSRSQAFDDRELRPLSLKTWPPADGLCYVAPLLGMEVSLIPFLRKAVPRAAAALIASSLVVSCATSTEAPQAAATGRNPSVAADVNLERVVLQAYRAIGDRHLFDPNFRPLSTETYRGFAGADPAMVLETSDGTFTVRRDGREGLSRPPPADPADGRAWGGMLAELMAGSLDASPALQHTDRQTLIREAMTATTKQLDRNSRYADPDEARDNRFQRDGGGGVGIPVERTDDKRIIIRAVQEGSPAAKAGVQAGDQILSIDGESMIERPLRDVVGKLRGSVGAPVTITVLRATQGGEYVLSMKRSRIIPTTVTYERRGDVALIHLPGCNSATTDNLKAAIDKARAELGNNMAGVIIDMRSNRGGLLDQAQTVSE